MGTSSLQTRLAIRFFSAITVYALLMVAAHRSIAQDALTPFTILPPPEQEVPVETGAGRALMEATSATPAESVSSQPTMTPLPLVDGDSPTAESEFASGELDQFSPSEGELPPAFTFESDKSQDDIELPPAFVPNQKQPVAVAALSTEAHASEAVRDEDLKGASDLLPPAPEDNQAEAHLNSVFPSLPAPPQPDVADVPPIGLRADARATSSTSPRVAQYGDPGIMFDGQSLPGQHPIPEDGEFVLGSPDFAQPQGVAQPGSTEVGQLHGWWQPHVGAPMRNTAMPRNVSINGLVAAALEHSSQIKVISDSPLIRDTAIIEADAAFDWATFMETAWNDTNEPVGSTLTTGGPPRFRDSRFDFEAGLRRQTGLGGQFEAGQRYGHENSNSIFFVPNDQGTSRLTLSYTQPLLRGAGRAYNTSLIVLAQIDSAIARDDFSRQLQEHLLEITRSYWTLYLERASLLQRQRLYDRGQEILQELEYRETIDAVQNQIVRARAAVASRKSDLFRAAAAVKNAEGRIRALVNAPDLGVLDEFELTPGDLPTTQFIPVDMCESLEMAIRSRPEINVAMKQIKASAVRLKMSKNELLPLLDVVLETYVAGLKGNSGVGRAVEQQFADGSPSYTAGLQFEVPLRNRAARARFQRRNLELRQFESQFQNTLQALQLEIEIAVREVQTTYREIEANFQSMRAAEAEVDYIAHRWELLPGEDRSASLILEDLLAAQERLAAEEFEFANSQVNYNLALMNLKRTMGTLLQFERVAVAKSEDCGIPSLWLHKADVAPTSHSQPVLEFGPE